MVPRNPSQYKHNIHREDVHVLDGLHQANVLIRQSRVIRKLVVIYVVMGILIHYSAYTQMFCYLMLFSLMLH